MMFIPVSIYPWLLTAAGIVTLCTGELATGLAMTVLGGGWLAARLFHKSLNTQEG